jgi:hypothetical protein
MKTFVLALVAMTLFTSAYAALPEASTLESYGNMAIMMGGNQLGIGPECLSDLTQGWNLVVQIYDAFTTGKSSDLFNIVMQIVPLFQKIQTDCFGK